MEDEKTINLSGDRSAVIRTRVTMKDKFTTGRVASRMMDMSLGDDNKPIIKINMEQRQDLDEKLLHLFVLSVGGKAPDFDTLEVADGEVLLDAVWEANGARLGLDRSSGFANPERAAAIPKGNGKS